LLGLFKRNEDSSELGEFIFNPDDEFVLSPGDKIVCIAYDVALANLKSKV